jgi:NAD(P)-dependent dehydrogenase (short-subunit alcohol dehydrogenase family)
MIRFDFSNKAAVVTGAAGGMGYAVALGILDAGARWR